MGGRAVRLVLIAGLLAACEPNAADDSTSPPDDSTSPPAASTTPSTLIATTEGPTKTTVETTTSTEVDIDNATIVSAVAIDLPEEILTGSEGLIIGVGEEFTFPDGAGGLRNIVVRVEDGVAIALRGRWCGNSYGPAPLDDTMGGTVVAHDEGGTLRCTPGEDSYPVHHTWPPFDTASVRDRAVVALPWDTQEDSGVDLLDLLDSRSVTLFTTDREVEFPLAASRSDDGEWVITVAETGTESPRVRYVFVDDSGRELDVPSNPQPAFPDVDTGFRAAAFSPDGNRLGLIAERDDGSTDVVFWDLGNSTEIERFGIEVTTLEQVRSIALSADRLIVNIESRSEEIHPSGFVVVDLATAERTEIGGTYPPLEFRNASFIER